LNNEKVIKGIRDRNETVIAGVITKYSRMLWSIAAPILYKAGTSEDVEECVADTFIYLWEHPDKYDPVRGSISTWLAIVVRTKALNRYRQLVKNTDIPFESAEMLHRLGIADSYPDGETAAVIAEALDMLHEQEREIFLRRYYYEQKPHDIAIALNISTKQVGNRLYRAKSKLRKAIKR